MSSTPISGRIAENVFSGCTNSKLLSRLSHLESRSSSVKNKTSNSKGWEQYKPRTLLNSMENSNELNISPMRSRSSVSRSQSEDPSILSQGSSFSVNRITYSYNDCNNRYHDDNRHDEDVCSHVLNSRENTTPIKSVMQTSSVCDRRYNVNHNTSQTDRSNGYGEYTSNISYHSNNVPPIGHYQKKPNGDEDRGVWHEKDCNIEGNSYSTMNVADYKMSKDRLHASEPIRGIERDRYATQSEKMEGGTKNIRMKGDTRIKNETIASSELTNSSFQKKIGEIVRLENDMCEGNRPYLFGGILKKGSDGNILRKNTVANLQEERIYTCENIKIDRDDENTCTESGSKLNGLLRTNGSKWSSSTSEKINKVTKEENHTLRNTLSWKDDLVQPRENDENELNTCHRKDPVEALEKNQEIDISTRSEIKNTYNNPEVPPQPGLDSDTSQIDEVLKTNLSEKNRGRRNLIINREIDKLAVKLDMKGKSIPDLDVNEGLLSNVKVSETILQQNSAKPLVTKGRALQANPTENSNTKHDLITKKSNDSQSDIDSLREEVNGIKKNVADNVNLREEINKLKQLFDDSGSIASSLGKFGIVSEKTEPTKMVEFIKNVSEWNPRDFGKTVIKLQDMQSAEYLPEQDKIPLQEIVPNNCVQSIEPKLEQIVQGENSSLEEKSSIDESSMVLFTDDAQSSHLTGSKQESNSQGQEELIKGLKLELLKVKEENVGLSAESKDQNIALERAEQLAKEFGRHLRKSHKTLKTLKKALVVKSKNLETLSAELKSYKEKEKFMAKNHDKLQSSLGIQKYLQAQVDSLNLEKESITKKFEEKLRESNAKISSLKKTLQRS